MRRVCASARTASSRVPDSGACLPLALGLVIRKLVALSPFWTVYVIQYNTILCPVYADALSHLVIR